MHISAKRRLAAAALALLASAALVATATGAHWPMFGGDAGHSGHQPVDEGGRPIQQRYALTEPVDRGIQTSAVITGGAPVDAWRLAYGTQQTSPSADAFAHLRRLVDGTRVGPAQGADIGDDAPVQDTDHFTGSSGSVTPVDTSLPNDPGVVLFLHNDDNQDGSSDLGNGSPDPRTGDDIALAMVDVETGQIIRDDALGTNNPEAEDTINMTVSSSPVLGPLLPGAVPTRELFFVAERTATSVNPVASQTPCNPNASFEAAPTQGVRGCNVPAQRKLFKVTITNPAGPDAQIAAVTSVEIGAQLNVKASPTLLRMDDPGVTEGPRTRTYVAVGTNDGFVRTYDATDLSAGPVSSDLGDVVNTPVVPVRSDGDAAPTDPPIYVTVNQGTTSFRAYELHRVEQPAPALAVVDATRDQSGLITGTPATAPAVSAAAENVPAGGRLVITADKNMYSLNVNDLADGNEYDLSNSLVAGTTGFSRTTPALSNGFAYVQRDNGEHLVLDEVTLSPVDGFTPYGDAGGGARSANDGIGQPAIGSGFIAFTGADGAFVYRNQNAPTVEIVAPPAGSTLTGTVKLRATAYNMRSGVAKVVFLLNGIEAGEGVFVGGSPTSSTDPGVYELNFDSRTFGNGQYQLTARATDADTGPDAPAEASTSAGRNVTILNETPTQLAVNDVEVAEGDEGTREATFTITKAGPNAADVTVATQDGSATAGSDFDAVRTELSFAAGDTTRTLTVPIRGDRVDEVDETFTVVLSAPTGGAGLADANGLGIIRDDDATPAGPGPNDPVVSVSSASIGEGPRGRTRRMTFDVSLSRPVGAPVTVSFATADQTAQAPGDYRATSGSLTFEPGQLTRTFTVPVVGDGLVEGNEVFLVQLSNVAGAGLGNATGTGQIVDDEVARGARQRPSSLTLRVKPRRDRRAPFRFTSTGNLIAPAGLSPLAACQGRVAVQVKAGRKTISTRRVRVRDNCTFRSTVTFRDRKRIPRNGRLTFRARFAGNGMLLARSSKRVGARTR